MLRWHDRDQEYIGQGDEQSLGPVRVLGSASPVPLNVNTNVMFPVSGSKKFT